MNITENEYYLSVSHEDRLSVLEEIGEKNIHPLTWVDRFNSKDSETWPILALDPGCDKIVGWFQSSNTNFTTLLTRENFISRFTKVVTTHNSSVLKHFFN